MAFIFILTICAVIAYFLYRVFKATNQGGSHFDIDESDPDKDSWEGGFWETLNPKSARARLAFAYTAANRQSTQRVVDVREFDSERTDGLLIGHCHLRNATRTFRFDRMRKVTDTETGEVVTNVPEYLREKYEASPDATLDKLMADHRDLLRALLYLGKADGRLTSKERSTILDLAIDVTGDSRLNDVMLKQTFNNLAVPSMAAFKQCCGRLANNKEPGYCAKIVIAAKKMVASETTIDPAEQAALDYLRKRLV